MKDHGSAVMARQEAHRLKPALFVLYTKADRDAQFLESRERSDTFHWSGDTRMQIGDRVLLYHVRRHGLLGTALVMRDPYYSIAVGLWPGVATELGNYQPFRQVVTLHDLRAMARHCRAFQAMRPQRLRDPVKGKGRYYAHALFVPEPYATRTLARLASRLR
jgi:hypothetical protein